MKNNLKEYIQPEITYLATKCEDVILSSGGGETILSDGSTGVLYPSEWD